MAERNTSITPTREERRPVRYDPLGGWGANPFRSLQRLADEMDRMFEDVGLGRRWRGSPAWSETTALAWAPEVDVFQKDNELTIRADLPGLRKEDISVEVTDDAVTITGERRRESEEEREGYYRSERSYGSFHRVVPLPEGAITEQAKAQFRDGVLQIAMPVPPAAKGRRLEITEPASQK